MTAASYIEYNQGSTAFVGPDATAFFRAAVIVSGLRLYGRHKIRPSRCWTPTAMLTAATGITGKPYKRGAYLQAADDVERWAREMKAALPQIDNTEA